MLCFWKAKKSPLLPNPDWTSSAIKQVLWILHCLEIYFKNSVSGWSSPPTPCIASKITAHTSPFDISSKNSILLLKSMNFTSICLFNNDFIFSLSVMLNEALLLPWNEFLKAIILDLFVWNDAICNAFSFASAPLLLKKNL